MQAIRNPVDAAKFAASVIRRHVPDPAYRVFLFGSRATGTAGERSDIDIGIEGPAPVPRAALAAIHDELEEAPTLTWACSRQRSDLTIHGSALIICFGIQV
jgi:predicted nucleotidyltransferase